jgi:ABC-type lipopolysaccharide export system ATPase subunit
MQAANRVVRLYVRVLLGTWNLEPDCGSELGIERARDVTLQAIADHHSTVRCDAKLAEQDLKNLRARLSDAMFAGNRNRIEVATES